MSTLITSLEFFPNRNDGLKPFKIDKLGEVVLLVGKNGSGKTRILSAIQNTLNSKTELENNEYIRRLEDQIKISRRDLFHATGHGRGRELLQERLLKEELELGTLIRFTLDHGLRQDRVPIISLPSPARIDFKDPDDLSERAKTDIVLKESESTEVDNTIVHKLNESELALIRIDAICRQHLADIHPYCQRGDQLDTTPDLFSKLKDIIKNGAQAELGFVGLKPILDKKSLKSGAELLSHGQRKLLLFLSTICSVQNISEPFVVLVDELETFLHPAAFIALIENLRSIFKNSQIFVATHSVPTIAYFGHENVWWVDDGHVSYAGRKTYEALQSILGGQNNIEKIKDLALEPARLAALTFSAECLLPPKVVDTPSGDAQLQQIKSAIWSTHADSMKILDWGAGKGRLLNALMEHGLPDSSPPIDYVAFDNSEASYEYCLARVNQFFPGEGRERCFKEFSKLRTRYEHAFDAVVLCNVLHEISPSAWQVLFADISKIIKPTGHLLVVEDAELPHGEMAHSEGFIIADEMAIRKLFDMKDRPHSLSSTDPRYQERLYAFVIEGIHLGNVSYSTVKSSLEWCHSQTLHKISELRDRKKETYRDGLRHSLLAQQYVNSGAALLKMTGSVPKG